jgi:hypothetical protein
MVHTSGLQGVVWCGVVWCGVVQDIFKRIQQKHIPLTNFVVFANVYTLLYSEEENVKFSLGKISNEMAHRLSILETMCLQITDDNRQIRLLTLF